MFWPEIAPSSLHLTPKLEEAERKYEAAFHHFKPDKHLRWLQEQGTASVTLELEDRTVTVEVTPLQAAVAECFESQDTWTEDGLAKQLEVDVILVRGALAVWAGHGVLKNEDDGSWRVLEVLEALEEGGDHQGESPSPHSPHPSTNPPRYEVLSLTNTAVPVADTRSGFQSTDKTSAEEKGSMFWSVSGSWILCTAR